MGKDPSRPDRFERVAHGVTAAVFERARPIPPRLELLLEGGEGWPPLRVAWRSRLRLGGASTACAADEHRLVDWLEGFHTGSDHVVRYLRLQGCDDCGAVCVRDISYDVLPTARPSSRPPLRRNRVIGWYTGARPRQRQYA